MAALRVYNHNFKDGRPSQDEYLSRLMKLLPGEIVALYTLGAALFKDDIVGQRFCIAASLVTLLVLRSLATRSNVTGIPQWLSVAISAVSFVIWLFVLGGPVESVFNYKMSYAVFAMALWTTIVPVFYKGDGQP
jgi:hypothetical protein